MYITALKSDAEIVASRRPSGREAPNLQVVEVWTRLQMGAYMTNSLFIAVGTSR